MLLLVNRQIMYYKKKSVNKEICNSLKTLDKDLRHLYCIIQRKCLQFCFTHKVHRKKRV